MKITARKGCAALLLLMGIWLLSSCGGAPAEEVSSPTPSPTSTPAPTPVPKKHTAGYMTSEDGLFRPGELLTEDELLSILSPVEMPPAGEGEPQPLTAGVLRGMLTKYLGEEAAERGLRFLFPSDDTLVDRANAAVCLNRAFGLQHTNQTGYFPDVDPDFWAYRDILTACSCETPLGTKKDPLPEGPLLVDCELFWIGEDGYALKNDWHGSLYFGSDGRYRSGSDKLDELVTARLRSVYTPGMTREELLKAAYDLVRDSFTYRIRNYYRNGDNHFALSEALVMYSTGKGNCYNYAAAFWAAARALGWEARLISGTYGEDEAPHGWVEILGSDGESYTYDVEIEMKSRLQGNKSANLFAMTSWQRTVHDYDEFYFVDDLVPREGFRTPMGGSIG